MGAPIGSPIFSTKVRTKVQKNAFARGCNQFMRSEKLFRRFKSTLLLALAFSLWWLPSAALGGTAILFGGRPAELTLSEVSDRTLRIELAQLDEDGRPRRSEPSTVLVPVPAVEKLRVRQ